MAKQLSSVSADRGEAGPGDMSADSEDAADELSLEDILMLYGQPINEEQAWAVCYQGCRAASPLYPAGRVEGPGDVRIQKDGTVSLRYQGAAGASVLSRPPPCTNSNMHLYTHERLGGTAARHQSCIGRNAADRAI